MGKIVEKFIKYKYYLIGGFLLLALISALLNPYIKINYNISDYLDEDTDTKIALEIMNEEFTSTGNLQVMLENVSLEDAKLFKKQISNIDDVLTVNFDPYSENYYKDGKALYVVLVDGDDYSQEGKTVLASIQDLVNEKNMEAEFAGSISKNQNQRAAIGKQMPFIIFISILIAMVITIITTNSYLEPFIFLASAGVAVVINMGTNIIFGEISYITNAVSSILQLALAMDYSIMILHSYHKNKEIATTKEEAMKNAILNSLRPVSASALTTITGLLALLFMSFTIGFDIGIVLMKGIVISAIVALTLFPCGLLVFDKFLDKTKIFKKQDLEEEKIKKEKKGNFFTKIAAKRNIIIVPAVLIVIIVTLFLQGLNDFKFTDNSGGNTAISEVFKESNTIVLVYKKQDNSESLEQKFITNLSNYITASGNKIFKDYTSYYNTVLEEYSVDSAVKKIGVGKEEARMLFALYQLNKNPDCYKLTAEDFLTNTISLMKTDEDVKQLTSAETKLTISRLNIIYDSMKTENTSDEFINKLSTGDMEGFVDFNSDYITQLYGNYLYDKINDKDIVFKDLIAYLVEEVENNPLLQEMLDSDTISSLNELNDGINTLLSKAAFNAPKGNFKTIMLTYGVSLDDFKINQIYRALGGKSSYPFIEILGFMEQNNLLSESDKNSQIKEVLSYYDGYVKLISKYSYNNFILKLKEIVKDLTNEVIEINIEDEAIRQLYIMYYNKLGLTPDNKVLGIDLINYTLNLCETNSFFNGFVSDDLLQNLVSMKNVYEVFSSDNLLNYNEMCDKLAYLQESSGMASDTKLSNDIISGSYLKISLRNNAGLELKRIVAKDLAEFLNENMTKNEVLSSKLTDEMVEQINDANKLITNAECLFKGDEYDRMLISVYLPLESEDSFKFVEDAKRYASIFFDEAYVAGEIPSTYDLKTSFDKDNTFITIFTIITLLLIILVSFKSLSVPVILVLIIQGAIWIAMTFFVVINKPLFFMSYIVSSCILMGATIDYGILLSDEFTNKRKELSKEEALKEAVITALPTILSSGTVLIACGFVISLISSQNSISNVGLLLGVGTIASVIMILFVLPSFLYFFDKLILKTTKK